ncbi:MAG TPA: biosynthetic arginine decarboxylase [Gemmatimonadaceae bacterium]|jgi:arginine decarboxylase|nr:biosynthetic arginine decarboxylase [Gemmatimonadaceae bacterium]
MTSTRISTPSKTAAPSPPPPPAEPWTIASARALYNIEGWGIGFFDINEAGHVVVRPDRAKEDRELDLFDLANDLEEQGVGLPLLLRFSDILRSRIESLNEKFLRAREEYGYDGGYTTVYPIKVNQQRHVVEEIVEFGKSAGVGLECGSKPELQAVLGLAEHTDHLIVCNGYKDEEFMRLALMGQKLGHQVFIVLEQLSEVDVLLKVADELGVNPTAGVRIKLYSEGSGRWAKSGGEKSKFGLSTAQLVRLVDKLNSLGRLDILKLIHFHLGSQITDIRYIKAGLQEITRYYAEMRGLGVDITHVDVGGGLGVDYDGSSSTSQASVNYTLQEYADDVIYTISEACRQHELPMPHIISESGRALTAHHALLLLRVIDVESQADNAVPELNEDHHGLLHEMAADYASVSKRVSKKRVREVFHDATFDKERAQELFNSGVLTLRDRAITEQIYLSTIAAVARIARHDRDEYSDIIDDVEATMVDRYFCNFSLFQSLPDSWAIDQIFPIMPIHRLNEEPTRRGTIQDVTCDSDGKIETFIGDRTPHKSLELHPFNDGDPYIIGIFLTGAYQEILGDLHNLFGDTNAVHIRLSESKGYEVTDLVHGDTVTEVLDYVQFRASDLLATFRRKVANATGIERQEANMFIADYVAGLEGYTYLEGEAAR